MNQVNLVGRITRDIELKQTKTGGNVAFFTIAVNEYAGNNERKAVFIPCAVFDKIAVNAAQYTGKGSLISVQGKLSVRRVMNTMTNREEEVIQVNVERMEFLSRKNETTTDTQPKYSYNEATKAANNPVELENNNLISNDEVFLPDDDNIL